MKEEPLIKTNPYLRDPKIRKRLIERSVSSSCGVEGIKVNFKKKSGVKIIKRRDKKIYKSAS